MSPPKPRRYDGPVPFILQAQAYAATHWPQKTMEAVLAAFPYPRERRVRPKDWVALVSHVSTGHGEDPVVCAERLALYVTAYAEANAAKAPSPAAVRRTQDNRLKEPTT